MKMNKLDAEISDLYRANTIYNNENLSEQYLEYKQKLKLDNHFYPIYTTGNGKW